MKWAALLAVITAVLFVTNAHEVAAQVAPGAPSIASVSLRDTELRITWTAPASDGGSPIDRYDVRYIPSDAPGKDDPLNWEEYTAWDSGGGAFEYTITGLTNDVSYDVQVRADNGQAGLWSATRLGTPAVQNRNAEFAAAPYMRTAREDLAIGGTIDAPVTATDPDRDALTYTITSGEQRFTIDSRTGQLRLRRPLDFEDRASHVVFIDVTDSRDSNGDADMEIDDTTTVTIMVEDVDESPEIGGDRWEGHPEHDTGVIETYTATDPEGTTTTWSALTGPDARHFTLGASGELSFTSGVDYESPGDANRDNRYQVTVRAADAGGRTGTLDVTVIVTDTNEAPVISGPAAVSVNENSTRDVATFTSADPDGATAVWLTHMREPALAGADAEFFDFEDGRLSFKKTPLHDNDEPDAKNTYEVTLRSTDGSLTGELDVTISVVDVAEPGTLVPKTRQPHIGVNFLVELEDDDWDEDDTPTWTFERSTSRTGGWTTITTFTETNGLYVPVDADLNHYLRATAVYDDAFRTGQRLQLVSEFITKPGRTDNMVPVFPPFAGFTIIEGIAPGTFVGFVPMATDPEGDPILYGLTGPHVLSSFEIDSMTGEVWMADDAAFEAEVFDWEESDSFEIQMVAFDSFGNQSGSSTITITITDVDEPPETFDDAATTAEDAAVDIEVVGDEQDPEKDGDDTLALGTAPLHGTAAVKSPTDPLDPATVITYTPNADYHGADFFTYTLTDVNGNGSEATVRVTITPTNDAPAFADSTAERSVSDQALPGYPVGDPVTATDIDGDTLTYSLSNAPAEFVIDDDTGQISVSPTALFDSDTYTLTLTAADPSGGTASIDVTVTVTSEPVRPPPVILPPPSGGGGGGFVGGGGGGGGGGPTPSDVEFEWTVERDIEELDSGNDWSTGLWSDGTTLFIAENGQGTDDEVYAYDLETGERVEDRQFELDQTNRAPRGFWSDRRTVWVSDSGQDRLFAYDLQTGERLEERELELPRDNRAARGIWSDDGTMWVLDGRADALFAYDLATGDLLGEYELVSANGDPHGLWSDGTTVWVSDHGAKRLFAYRLPARPEAPAAADAEATPLTRVQDEEFTRLSRASNNSPRGIWSDGDVMYVADESDDKVYSYNMPAAIDARLASLSLSGVDIGEFSPNHEEYEGAAAEGVMETTVEAEAMQRGTTVATDPPDADEDAEGHQVAVEGGAEITVTVTSEDGSRTRVYRVAFPADSAAPSEQAPAASCLGGDVTVGFSLVVYGGGSVEDLVACAEGRNVTALYALDGGAYVSYILGAPGFVNEDFRALFADGIPALTPLTVKSEGPPSPDPSGGESRPGDATQPWPACLRGDVAAGFNLVLYEGGSVGDLDACAEGVGLAAVYALNDGIWVSYILGAPDFVNERFAGLYAEGVPSVTPLIVKRDGP